jgi:hypothetical protein
MRILSGTRLIQLVSSPDAASFAFVEKESVTCAMPESNVDHVRVERARRVQRAGLGSEPDALLRRQDQRDLDLRPVEVLGLAVALELGEKHGRPPQVLDERAPLLTEQVAESGGYGFVGHSLFPS